MQRYNTAQAMFLIREFYGERRTKRHNIRLMDHIEHGVKLLQGIGACDETVAAFALHPMFQNDTDLINNAMTFHALDPYVVALIMEYRSVANQGLRGRTLPEGLSIPMMEVQQMLIADKIQNKWSFLKYHKNTHAEAESLEVYFNQWLEYLGVDDTRYEHLVSFFNDPMENQYE